LKLGGDPARGLAKKRYVPLGIFLRFFEDPAWHCLPGFRVGDSALDRDCARRFLEFARHQDVGIDQCGQGVRVRRIAPGRRGDLGLFSNGVLSDYGQPGDLIEHGRDVGHKFHADSGGSRAACRCERDDGHLPKHGIAVGSPGRRAMNPHGSHGYR
jgi:hypothetical protein